VHTACNLSFFVKNERVHEVTDSHIHFKSGNVLKTVLDKDVETTVHKQEVISIQPFNSSDCDDVGCIKVIHRLQAFFYNDKRVAQSHCHSRASCFKVTLYNLE